VFTEFDLWYAASYTQMMNTFERANETSRMVIVSKDKLLECCPALAQQISTLTDADLDTIAENIEESLNETLEMALEIMLRQHLGLVDP
jgi:hypothetical protein